MIVTQTRPTETPIPFAQPSLQSRLDAANVECATLIATGDSEAFIEADTRRRAIYLEMNNTTETRMLETDAQRIARICNQVNARTATDQALRKLPTVLITSRKTTATAAEEVIEWR